MKEFIVRTKLMGTAFELCVVHDYRKIADEQLEAGITEIKRLEKLLSEFLPDSETTRINNNAAKKELIIDKDCFELIERCQAISQLTKGYFDISIGALKPLYSFKNKSFELPNEKAVKNILNQIGYQNILLDKNKRSIRLKAENLKISFAAIGKGFASDRVKKLWLQKGIKSGYINASGDLNAFGRKTDGAQWKVGIANPDNPENKLFYIPVENASVATSGDYEQYFLNNSTRYSHSLNPITGKPVTGVRSVTIFSPSAELSDALATAVYAMGPNKGTKFIDQLPKTHSIIVDDNKKIYFSKKLNYVQMKPSSRVL